MLDNYDLWQRHDAEQQRRLSELPECCYCSQPIQDEYAYLIDGEWVCEECMDDQFRKCVDNYIE